MADLEQNIDINIYIERLVARVGDFPYDPLLARPEFYAHIANLSEDVPSEVEIRIHNSWWDPERRVYDPMIRITPRQLNEMGDINIPLAALEAAVHQIQLRTEENRRAQAAHVGVSLDIEGDAEEQDDAQEEREQAGA